jgi:ferredoxin-thioredoxin reductase catalytic subunit
VTAAELHDMLQKAQEPKGYFFSTDRPWVEGLLQGLLANKERYGYMCCPCRLASGDRKADADIICPCAYRQADLAQYGSCYCNLYVSQEWNQGQIPKQYVPERRPAEKMGF